MARSPYLPYGISAENELSASDAVYHPRADLPSSASPEMTPGYQLWPVDDSPPGINRPNSAGPTVRFSGMSPARSSSADGFTLAPPSSSLLDSLMDAPPLVSDNHRNSSVPPGPVMSPGPGEGPSSFAASEDGFTLAPPVGSLLGSPMDVRALGTKDWSPAKSYDSRLESHSHFRRLIDSRHQSTTGVKPLPFDTLASHRPLASLPPAWTEGADGSALEAMRSVTPPYRARHESPPQTGSVPARPSSGFADSLGSVGSLGGSWTGSGSVGSRGGSWTGSWQDQRGTSGWPSASPVGSGMSHPSHSPVAPIRTSSDVSRDSIIRGTGSAPDSYDQSPSMLDQGSMEHPVPERPGRALFVRNLDSSVDDAYLRSLFEMYGEVKSMHTQSRNRGFVIIHYYDIRHAQAALENLQGHEVNHRTMHIYYATKKPNPSEGDQNNGTLVVFNLAPSMTTAQVMDIFGRYGEVMEVRETPHRPHYKFVEFYDSRAAQRAKDLLNKREILGHKIKVDWSRPTVKTTKAYAETKEAGSAHSMPEGYPPRMDTTWLSPPPSSLVHGSAPSYIGPPLPGYGSPYGDDRYRTQYDAPTYSPSYPTGLVLTPYHSTEAPLATRSKHSSRHDGSSSKSSSRGRGKSKPSFALDIEKVKRGEESRTTLMIRNIPNKYSQKMMLEALDRGHAGRYDFFYLPIDFKNSCNVGYAFINFIKREFIPAFYYEFNNQKWELFNSEKVCEITWGRIQGKDALIAHFQNSSLMSEDETCRPCIFYSSGPKAGQREPFPLTGKTTRNSKRGDHRGRSRSNQE